MPLCNLVLALCTAASETSGVARVPIVVKDGAGTLDPGGGVEDPASAAVSAWETGAAGKPSGGDSFDAGSATLGAVGGAASTPPHTHVEVLVEAIGVIEST